MYLTFDEIADGDHFEDLVADFFRALTSDNENNITNVEIFPTGTGTDAVGIF